MKLYPDAISGRWDEPAGPVQEYIVPEEDQDPAEEDKWLDPGISWSANSNEITIDYAQLQREMYRQQGELISKDTSLLKVPEELRKEVSMQLTIRGKSAMKLRSIERLAVKAAYGYSDVFDMSYGLTKTGLSIRKGTEHAVLTFNAEKTLLRIKAKFKKEPSNKFRGAVVGYFGVLVHVLKNGQFEFSIVPEETQLPNLEVVQNWGRWAYGKLHEADPTGMPKLISS